MDQFLWLDRVAEGALQVQFGGGCALQLVWRDCGKRFPQK
jgi:hypothetical protein